MGKELEQKHGENETIICVIGLGYVGLPLANAFARSFKVIGFDIDNENIAKLSRDSDNSDLRFTTDPKEISQADFVILCLPTPVTRAKQPDLSHLQSAARTVSQNMKRGCTVVMESTVYPGVTEEVLKPILEESGLKCGVDFRLAYSPERINPGDKGHTLDKVVKVISGIDEETTKIVAELYQKVTPNIFKARDIKTAEAAKVIENIQRDLNIALMNELAIIFERMGLSISDILEAAATKWNFHRYSPGLVGGHCIPVDPYYLVYKAEELGYHPQVILAGRAINNYMPKHVAEITIKALNQAGKVLKNSRVLIMGLTYKENVADTRETPVKDIIKELKEYGVEVSGYDPLLSKEEINAFGIEALDSLEDTKTDCVIVAAAHDAFRGLSLDKFAEMKDDSLILVDVRNTFDGKAAREKGLYYRSL